MGKLDNEIFPAVKILNEKGYETKFSCQGHSFSSIAYITFKDKELMDEIYKKYGVPDRWYADNFLPDDFTIRGTLNNFWYLVHRNVKINGKVLTYEELHEKEINCLNK